MAEQKMIQPIELVFGAPIQGVVYQFTVLHADPEVARAAFRVQKAGTQAVYEVVVAVTGRVECSCKDFQFRHAGKADSGCKHIRKLRSLSRALATLTL